MTQKILKLFTNDLKCNFNFLIVVYWGRNCHSIFEIKLFYFLLSNGELYFKTLYFWTKHIADFRYGFWEMCISEISGLLEAGVFKYWVAFSFSYRILAATNWLTFRMWDSWNPHWLNGRVLKSVLEVYFH